MNQQKRNKLIRIIDKSYQTIGDLAGQYIKGKPEEREAIMAGIQFEREFVENCQFCLG